MNVCDHCNRVCQGDAIFCKGRSYCSPDCFEDADLVSFRAWDYREHHEDPDADREPPEREEIS